MKGGRRCVCREIMIAGVYAQAVFIDRGVDTPQAPFGSAQRQMRPTCQGSARLQPQRLKRVGFRLLEMVKGKFSVTP